MENSDFNYYSNDYFDDKTDYGALRMNINAMKVAVQSFSQQIPPLEALSLDSNPLKTIAKNLHEVFESNKDVLFTADAKKELEKIICAFTYFASQTAVNNSKTLVLPHTKIAKSPNYNVENFDKLTKQLVITNEMNKELHHKNKAAIEVQNHYKSEIESLNEKNESLFREKTTLVQKLHSIQREMDEKESKHKAEIDELKDQSSNAEDKYNQIEYETTRMKKQLDDFADEIGHKNAEISMLKTKVQTNKMKVKEYKKQTSQAIAKMREVDTENEQLNIQITDLERMYNDYANEFNQDEVQNLTNENKRLAETIDMMMQQIKENYEELEEATKLKEKYTTIIKNQMNLLNTYDAQIKEINKENAQKEAELVYLKPRAVEKEEKEADSVNDVYFNAIFELLKSNYKEITKDNVFEVIQGLLKGSTESPLSEMNRRLCNIIENQLDFISNVANKGEFRYSLLSSDERNNPFMDNDYIKEQILIEAARCRTFISMNNLKAQEKNETKITKEKLDELNDSSDLQQREIFDIITVQSQNADLMRIFCENLIDLKEKQEEELKKAAEIINYEGDIEEVYSAVVDKLRNYRSVAKRLNDVTNNINFNNYDESLKSIEEGFKHNLIIRNMVDGELRECTNYSGSDLEVVAYTAKYFRDMMNDLNELSSYKPKEIIAQMEEITKNLEDERENNERAISKLETELDDMKVENSELSSNNEITKSKLKEITAKLYSANNKNKECNTKIELLEQTIKTLEDEITRLRNENEEANNKIASKESLFQNRMDSMLENERKRHAQEIEDRENNYKAKINVTTNELNDKSSKLKEMKRIFRQAIRDYETVFKKQKETINNLRDQNNGLINRYNSIKTSKNKEKGLSGAIKSLESENSVLQIRIKQLNEKFEKMQNEKDAYWQSQLSLKELELDTKYQEQIEDLEQKQNDFIIQASTILNSDATNESTLLNALTLFVDELNETKKRIEAESNKVKLLSAKKEEEDANVSKIQKIIKSLKDWERWATEIYKNSTGFDPKKFDEFELRHKLSEMILTSISSKKLINDRTSLREQKAALLKGANRVVSLPDFSFSSLAIAISFTHMLNKFNRKPTNINCMKRRNALRKPNL